VKLDKVKLARAAIGRKPGLEVLDLEQRITELVEFIRLANPG
jgi:hypothetical protein